VVVSTDERSFLRKKGWGRNESNKELNALIQSVTRSGLESNLSYVKEVALSCLSIIISDVAFLSAAESSGWIGLVLVIWLVMRYCIDGLSDGIFR
jgi:hypothetical protein